MRRIFCLKHLYLGELQPELLERGSFSTETLNDKIWQACLNPASDENCLPRTSTMLSLITGSLELSKPGSELKGSDPLLENLIRAQLTAARPHLSMLLFGVCFPLCYTDMLSLPWAPAHYKILHSCLSYFNFRWVSLELSTSSLRAMQEQFHRAASFHANQRGIE